MLYQLIKTYIKTGLFLFYKNIKETGKENIPNKGPVLFLANHQNAMMDPLIIATANKSMYFIARASAFKNRLAAKLLTHLHLIKIYRKRDGVDSKKLNETVFSHCLEVLNNGNNMLIFPEGSHHIIRKVRSLRAGFTRIAFDYLKANPTKDLTIIPIGLNYDNTLDYAKTVHVIYGNPIKARAYYDATNLEVSKEQLIAKVQSALIEQTVYINNEAQYETIIANLEDKEFLTPKITNNKLKTFKPSLNKIKKSNSKNIFYYLMLLNSILPFFVWNWLKPKVEAIEFRSTAKFSLGLVLFPIIYFIQTLLVKHFFGGIYALAYIILCFILIILSTKLGKK